MRLVKLADTEDDGRFVQGMSVEAAGEKKMRCR